MITALHYQYSTYKLTSQIVYFAAGALKKFE